MAVAGGVRAAAEAHHQEDERPEEEEVEKGFHGRLRCL
jgi:hypothetical protein